MFLCLPPAPPCPVPPPLSLLCTTAVRKFCVKEVQIRRSEHIIHMYHVHAKLSTLSGSSHRWSEFASSWTCKQI